MIITLNNFQTNWIAGHDLGVCTEVGICNGNGSGNDDGNGDDNGDDNGNSCNANDVNTILDLLEDAKKNQREAEHKVETAEDKVKKLI